MSFLVFFILLENFYCRLAEVAKNQLIEFQRVILSADAGNAGLGEVTFFITRKLSGVICLFYLGKAVITTKTLEQI